MNERQQRLQLLGKLVKALGIGPDRRHFNSTLVADGNFEGVLVRVDASRSTIDEVCFSIAVMGGEPRYADLRIASRASTWSQPSDVETGDVDFDETVVVLCESKWALSMFNYRTRGLISETVCDLGAIVSGATVYLGPSFAAQLDDSAGSLSAIQKMVKLAKNLATSESHEGILLKELVDDPVPWVAQNAQETLVALVADLLQQGGLLEQMKRAEATKLLLGLNETSGQVFRSAIARIVENKTSFQRVVICFGPQWPDEILLPIYRNLARHEHFASRILNLGSRPFFDTLRVLLKFHTRWATIAVDSVLGKILEREAATVNMINLLSERRDTNLATIFYKRLVGEGHFKRHLRVFSRTEQTAVLEAIVSSREFWARQALEGFFAAAVENPRRVDQDVLIGAIEHVVDLALAGFCEDKIIALVAEKRLNVAVAAANALGQIGTRECTRQLEKAAQGAFHDAVAKTAQKALEAVIMRVPFEVGGLSIVANEPDGRGELSMSDDEGGLELTDDDE